MKIWIPLYVERAIYKAKKDGIYMPCANPPTPAQLKYFEQACDDFVKQKTKRIDFNDIYIFYSVSDIKNSIGLIEVVK